jgi:hypothetical protein
MKINRTEKNAASSALPMQEASDPFKKFSILLSPFLILPSAFCLLLSAFSLFNSPFSILHSQFNLGASPLPVVGRSGFPLQVLARLRLVPGYPLQSLAQASLRWLRRRSGG